MVLKISNLNTCLVGDARYQTVQYALDDDIDNVVIYCKNVDKHGICEIESTSVSEKMRVHDKSVYPVVHDEILTGYKTLESFVSGGDQRLAGVGSISKSTPTQTGATSSCSDVVGCFQVESTVSMPVVSPCIVSNDMPVGENQCVSEKRYNFTDASGLNEIGWDEMFVGLVSSYLLCRLMFVICLLFLMLEVTRVLLYPILVIFCPVFQILWR